LAASDPTATVTAFVNTLAERWGQAAGPRDERVFSELLLAGNLLRLETRPAARDRPPQVAVIGPTQTGKSTVVNALLRAGHAKVSPLAGYTVHPQGYLLPAGGAASGAVAETLFAAAATEENGQQAWLDVIFPGWPRRHEAALRRDELRAYAFRTLAVADPVLGDGVVWDTPDFDSLAASAYREGLLAVVSAGDVFLLVLSKEKYSDATVWRLLELLAPLQRPLVVCLNKMSPDAVEVIRASLEARLATHAAGWREVVVVTLPQVADPAAGEGAWLEAAEGLRKQVRETLRRSERRTRLPAIGALIETRWEGWVAPIRREHVVAAAWAGLVDRALAGLLNSYQRDFLEHPDRYDSFRRATLELLQLLELPGVGRSLTRVREVVTWPARQVLAQGRWLLTGKGRARHDQLPNEQAFLQDEIEALLLGLSRDLLRRSDPTHEDGHIWQVLSRRFEGQTQTLRTEFREAARQHYERVQREVHATAGKAYAVLKEKPRLLNTLRAARATADATGVVFALQTGGLGMHDVLVAPALFGVTSLMTEGALGSYMQHLHVELKQRQYELARQELVAETLRQRLTPVGQRFDEKGLFGIGAEELAAARAALDALKKRA
jgi:hypothetical protein